MPLGSIWAFEFINLKNPFIKKNTEHLQAGKSKKSLSRNKFC